MTRQFSSLNVFDWRSEAGIQSGGQARTQARLARGRRPQAHVCARARGGGGGGDVADPLAREPGVRTMASASELILQDAGLDALASQTSSPVATSPAAQSPAVSPRDHLVNRHNRDDHHQQHHPQQHGKSDPSWVWTCLFPKDLSKNANPCFVPIADVIIFEEASDHGSHDASNGSGKRKAKKKRNQSRKSLRFPTRWVYTNDKGKLSYRTGKAISWHRIRDAFLALNEDENSICRVTMINGSSHTLDRATFQALLAGAKRDGGLSAVRTMQACVSLSKGREQLCCRASYSRQHGCRTKVLGGVPEDTLDFETALAGMCSEFVAALEVGASTPIEALSLDFAADRDGVLRVVQVSEVIRAPEKRDDPREEDTHRPTKRALTKPARRRGPSGRSDTAKLHTSSSPSLPSLSCRRDARSSSSSNAKSASGPTTSSLALRCSGDFCGLRVNQSDGLDVIEIDTWKSKEKLPHDASFWSAELDRVRAVSASRKHRRPEDSRMPSSSSMHRIGQRDILLARHAMHFITGAVRITDAALRDEEDFGRAWRQLDEKLQYDLGVKHPDQFYQDAQVCESCEQVYKRLETIRARNYHRDPVQRPQSERESAVRSDSTVKEASSSPSPLSSSKRHEVTSAPGRSESVSERSIRKEKGPKQKSSALSRRSRKEDGSVADQSSHRSKALTVPRKAKSEQDSDGTESQSKHSKPSLAETAFLMRHDDQLRSEQQAKVLQQERQESMQEIDRLRRDQQSNVAQIKALREALTKASHEAASQTAAAEELGESLRATQETLTTSQRGFTRVMQEKDEEIKRLALEMERVRHAALAAQSQGETSESLSAQLLDAAQAEHRLSQKVDELSQQVKDLEAENEALTTASAKTRKEVLREVQERAQDEVAKLAAEVERLSSANDEQAAESSELRHLLETQREKEAELRRQVNHLGGEKQRLQGHLDKAKQSLKSITSIGNSEDAAMAAVRATAEAKVQQVKNELDFVRKQAETESGFAEDLRGQLAELKRQQAEVVTKLKQESSELATRLKAELAEREKQFARELQIPRSQISLLEDKVSTLQTSLQKMGNEMAATNRKLQVSEMDLRRARDEALRSEEQKLALERNLAELQATLATQSAHQDDKTYEDGSGGDIDSESGFNADTEEGGTHTATSDQSAQLVRVQNEVEYLRKQVDVEERAKRELSKAVETTRAQLRKTIEDWKADVAAIQAQHRHILEQAESEAVALREAKLDATSEIKRLQSQLLEAREGFSRAREQLQTDQRALEASASAVSQLKEDLDEAQSRLAAAQERAERAERQQREEAHSFREELEAVREKRQEVVADLKSKLTSAHRQVSASHAAMLELRESSTQEMEVLSRQGAVRLIVAALQGRARLQACSAFYRMRTATVAASERQAAAEFADSLRNRHEETLHAELASLRSQMTHDAQKNLRQELENAQREHESAVRAIEKSCDEKWQRELDEATKSHHEALAVQLAEQQAIREAEEKRQREEARRAVATLEATHKAAFQSMVTRAAQEREEEVRTAREALQKQLRESLEEARKQHNAQLAEATERHDQALAAMREELTRDKDHAVASMMNSAETDCKCALEALEREMQSRIDAIRQELEAGHAVALKNSQEESAREADAKLAFALQEGAEKAAQDLAELRKELESMAHEEHARLSREHEDRVEQLTAEHRAQVRTLKEKHEAELAAQMDTSMSKLEEAVRRTREEERAERTQALTQSTEKWQRIVQECTEDGLREQERLVAEAAKAKAAAVEKVKLEARADIAARDTASTKSRAAFEEKLLQKSQAQLDELRGKLMAEHAKQLQAATEAAGKREEAALLRAQAEKERALRVQRNKATEQLERVKQEAETAKESALATCAREAASQMASALNREREQASEKLESLRESMERERKESEAAILEECDRVTDRKLEEAQLQLQEAVLKCRKQCEDQFGKELEQMRRERTQLMDDADNGMQAAHAERDRLRASLEKANAALEEAEDLAFDLQGRVERLEQAGRYFALKQKLEHGRTVAGFCRLKQRLEASTAKHIAEAEKRVNNQVERHEAQTQRAEDATRTLEKSRRRMHDILVNHKREDLLQHKVETGVIQDDLKKLQHSREALEKQREQLQRDVGYLEGQIRGVEQQLEQLSKVSAVQDGQINVTHAKRKRRLDQEFEHLLDRVAHQRKQIDAVNERIAAVQEDAELKEEDLREMEAGLVAILVEQQKLLLAELASVEKRSSQQTIDRQRQTAQVK